MRADEVKTESSTGRHENRKKSDSQEVQIDDVQNNKKTPKRRERGGQRDRRKKQNAARFPKKVGMI